MSGSEKPKLAIKALIEIKSGCTFQLYGSTTYRLCEICFKTLENDRGS